MPRGLLPPIFEADEAFKAAWDKFSLITSTRRGIDNSYKLEYKNFLSWLYVTRSSPVGDMLGLQTGGPVFITETNVNEYFTQGIHHRNANADGMARIHRALQWAFDNVEFPGAPVRHRVICKNGVVKEAIKKQQEQYFTHQNNANAGTDPHKDLKDLMSQEDIQKLSDYIYHDSPHYQSLGFCFNWGNQGGLRGDSARKLVLADLNLSFGFGPEVKPPNNKTILLILRKGGYNKDRFTIDNQVGAQRHVNFLQCSVFATAVSVINTLRTTPMNFYHVEKKKRAPWWDIPLIEFDTLSQQTHAIKQAYVATGVDSCKVTHHRTQCVQYGGSESLAPWQINTLTKHMIEKFHKSYQSNCDKETLKVMAGFKKEDDRFVPREHLVLPRPIQYYIDLLLPDYNQWVRQTTERRGDKSSCCKKFLFLIVPYLVEILVTDGIYLIQKCPNNPTSHLLKVCHR